MLMAMARWVQRHFLILACACAFLALGFPALFAWIRPYISLGLGLIMFGMGLTLEFADFVRVGRMWPRAGLGVVLQYTVMPLLAWGLCWALHLPDEVAVGVLLVGCCPSGTASNVITFFARADVPLSVAMTLVTTLVAPVVTPALVELFVGQRVAVDFWAMVRSVFWIVVFPLVDGLVLRRLLRERLRPVLDVFPALSVLAITGIIACVVALNQKTILDFPVLVMLAVMLHNGAGFAIGFWGARVTGARMSTARTIAIEVGMQNSGLAVALAGTFFTPAAALAGALFSLWQNLMGMALARVWARDGGQERG